MVPWRDGPCVVDSAEPDPHRAARDTASYGKRWRRRSRVRLHFALRRLWTRYRLSPVQLEFCVGAVRSLRANNPRSAGRGKSGVLDGHSKRAQVALTPRRTPSVSRGAAAVAKRRSTVTCWTQRQRPRSANFSATPASTRPDAEATPRGYASNAACPNPRMPTDVALASTRRASGVARLRKRCVEARVGLCD